MEQKGKCKYFNLSELQWVSSLKKIYKGVRYFASHPVEAVFSNTEILAISDPVTNGSHWFIEGMI